MEIILKLNDFVKLIILGIILIIGVYFGSKYFGSKQYKPDNSKYVLDVSVRYVDKPIYITKIKAKIDTVFEPIYNGIDTVFVPIAYAKADTLLKQDSSSIKVTYYYPPRNYFDLDLNIKEKIITHEITRTLPYEPTFWDRFNIVIYGGVGYDFIQRLPSISVGIGLGINIKKLF